MKKVWIASIFATLMLLVPLTSVVGASEVEDCNCKPISDSQVVRIERLLNRLENRINFILLRYGHIPEVAENFQEISNKITTLIEMKEEFKLELSLENEPVIFTIIFLMFWTVIMLVLFLSAFLERYRGTIWFLVLIPIVFPLTFMILAYGEILLSINSKLGCEDIYFP